MSDRWVCKRCFADNEEADSACQRCGLIRGADATQADQTGWAAAQPGAEAPPAEQPGWRRWIRNSIAFSRTTPNAPTVPMSPLRVVTLAAILRWLSSVSVPLNPP